jgi:hypothetical protein
VGLKTMSPQADTASILIFAWASGRDHELPKSQSTIAKKSAESCAETGYNRSPYLICFAKR